MFQKTKQKPISRNYAVTSDDVLKTKQKPISRNYAVKSDDVSKTESETRQLIIRFIWSANHANCLNPETASTAGKQNCYFHRL